MGTCDSREHRTIYQEKRPTTCRAFDKSWIRAKNIHSWVANPDTSTEFISIGIDKLVENKRWDTLIEIFEQVNERIPFIAHSKILPRLPLDKFKTLVTTKKVTRYGLIHCIRTPEHKAKLDWVLNEYPSPEKDLRLAIRLLPESRIHYLIEEKKYVPDGKCVVNAIKRKSMPIYRYIRDRVQLLPAHMKHNLTFAVTLGCKDLVLLMIQEIGYENVNFDVLMRQSSADMKSFLTKIIESRIALIST